MSTVDSEYVRYLWQRLNQYAARLSMNGEAGERGQIVQVMLNDLMDLLEHLHPDMLKQEETETEASKAKVRKLEAAVKQAANDLSASHERYHALWGQLQRAYGIVPDEDRQP